MPVIGKYIYIEASQPRSKGDRARLVTSMFPADKRCLQFFYHMSGKNIGKLTVYIKESRSSAYPEWVKTGEVGNDWTMALLNVKSQKPYQVSW